MIILAGTVDVDPEKRTAALIAGRPHVEATRAQKGCIDYAWTEDQLLPGRICVFERWESEQALETHFEGPHYQAMLQTIAAHGIRGIDVAKYRIALSEPVYDPQGKPRADFFTVGQ